MAIRTLIIFFGLLLTAAHASESPDTWLSADAIVADVELAQDAFERIHAGYTRYTDEATLTQGWQGIVERAEFDGGMRAGEFYLELQATLALIRCDHTKAELSANQLDWRKNMPTYLPVVWDLYGERGVCHQRCPGAGARARRRDPGNGR